MRMRVAVSLLRVCPFIKTEIYVCMIGIFPNKSRGKNRLKSIFSPDKH